MTRLALLGLSHESNTFAPTRAAPALFRAGGILRGNQIVERHATARDTAAGFLSVGGQPGVEVVPLLFARATPTGPVTRAALDDLLTEMLALLAAQGPWDGVLAALHGAAVAEHVPDMDGHVLRRIREVVGPGVPVGVALDLHANISPDMVASSDLLGTYRTNPHVDAWERAAEIAQLVVRAARGESRPTQALVQVPAVIDILCQSTDAEPMRSIRADLDAVLARPEVLTASVAEGYPYADVVEMGMSVVVVTEADPAAAERLAAMLARQIWARRAGFTARAPSVDEALRRVRSAPATPVLLLDVGDNIGGGSQGDSTVIIRRARALAVRGLLAPVTDEFAAATCHTAGVGASVRLRLGTGFDPTAGFEVTGRVRARHDGVYQDSGPTHSGQRHFDAGPTAVVTGDDGTTLILTSKVVGAYSSAQLPALGLDPAEFRAIVAKGVHSPLASYGPLAAEIIQVDTPGVTSADLTRLNYARRRRPLFPFEPDTRFP